MNRYEWIANRAYRLWEKAGRPSGRDWDFWLAAESEHDRSQRPQYGLRELRATDKMAGGNREREQEQQR